MRQHDAAGWGWLERLGRGEAHIWLPCIWFDQQLPGESAVWCIRPFGHHVCIGFWVLGT